MVHCAYPLNTLFVLCYRSGNSMKSFDVVNVLSQRNVCREVPVEREKCHFQWSSKCITDISRCISWLVVYTFYPSPTSLTSFCHLSLSTRVTIVTGCNIEGGKEKWSRCRRGRRGQTLPCAYVSHTTTSTLA